VNRLSELDTSNVQPMTQVPYHQAAHDSTQTGEPFAYASREDILEGLRKSLAREIALANAPETDGTFFRVPKVIDK
jgi:aspartyl-tRNA(Asn)/glutamyl-tRNA(Gln) amidotransferase subunit C